MTIKELKNNTFDNVKLTQKCLKFIGICIAITILYMYKLAILMNSCIVLSKCFVIH